MSKKKNKKSPGLSKLAKKVAKLAIFGKLENLSVKEYYKILRSKFSKKECALLAAIHISGKGSIPTPQVASPFSIPKEGMEEFLSKIFGKKAEGATGKVDEPVAPEAAPEEVAQAAEVIDLVKKTPESKL